MTFPQVKSTMDQIASSLGCEYSYRAFEHPIDSNQFFVFYYDGDNDVLADGRNYQKITTLNIELYSSYKDFEAESKLEAILENNGLV